MENHSKLKNSGSMDLHGALSLKMSTYMTEIDYLAHFYYNFFFPIKLLKIALVLEKLNFNIKHWKNRKIEKLKKPRGT